MRISESLDLDVVLQGVVMSTRELTLAGCSAITITDESGRLQHFVTSGLSTELKQQLFDMPRAEDVWDYLRCVENALRVDDLRRHLESRGFPKYEFLGTSYLGIPVRYRGVRLGSFHLIDKHNARPFTYEDEEILALFAIQAGAWIFNARKYRDEQRARADLEALIDTTPVGVVVFDGESGQPIHTNQLSRRIVKELGLPGLAPEALMEGLRVRRADGQEILLDQSSLSRALLASTTVRAEEIILEGPNGHCITIVVNATPLRSDQGTVESMIVTIQDMTPLEDLERMRAEFLGMVSHELRTPLAAIKGCATTVLEASQAMDRAETMQFFRVVNEQAEIMRTVISDLLDATRIETGTLSVSPAPADVASIVDQAKNTFQSAGRRHPVHIDLPLDLPRILADRQRIVQVIGNLLTNAARHSSESSVILITAVKDGVHVAISVTDKGQGIPAKRLPHVFRKYVHSGSKSRDRSIGTGLGLAICKGIVEAHGGRICVESSGTELGARFTFTVPMVAPAESGAPVKATDKVIQSTQPRQRKLSILVVDDDPQTLIYVRNVLAQRGFSCIATGDPQEVPTLITSHQPDLVLLDLLLPGTDGLALMESIPALADQPTIILSAYGREETIARALDIGADDYIVKPFSPTELVARIRAVLRRQNKPNQLFKAGGLAINYEERCVTVDNQPVSLTATEYNLLKILSVSAGRVLTYGFLLRTVWQVGDPSRTQLVRAFVKKLRRKLGDDAGNPVYIHTEPRVGYRMAKPDLH